MANKIFIHVGMNKTGSSAIQAFLKLNYEVLIKRGVLYPNPPKFDQAFQTSSGNAGLFHQLILNNELDKIRSIIESFDNKHTLILSSEALFHTLTEYPERFFDVFNQYDYKIICYVRRQDNLFSSCYNQLIKNHDATSRFVIEHIEQTNDFSATLLNSLKYAEANKFIIRPYEKQQFYAGNIYYDFLNCIGLDIDSNYIFPEKVVNPSLNWETLEFRRLLNFLNVDRDNPRQKYALNALLAQYTVDNNMGKPFQENNIFSLKERVEIINRYKEKNEQVAKIFLNRDDGQLFYETITEVNDLETQNEELNLEKVLDICKYIMQKKFNENYEKELVKIIAKGTIDRVIHSDELNDEDIQETEIIYSLNNRPINLL